VIRKTVLVLASVFALSSVSGAVADEKSTPILTVQNIVLNPAGNDDRLYSANVTLWLHSKDNTTNLSFSVSIPHVMTVDEVNSKLKSAVDDFADQIKKASEDFDKQRNH
jgi:hypothetical protein